MKVVLDEISAVEQSYATTILLKVVKFLREFFALLKNYWSFHHKYNSIRELFGLWYADMHIDKHLGNEKPKIIQHSTDWMSILYVISMHALLSVFSYRRSNQLVQITPFIHSYLHHRFALKRKTFQSL